MAKDPAFLFYSKDFMDGALGLTMEERGQYITLMCMQHQRGVLTRREIEVAAPGVSKYVMEKFTIDDDGNYYNERLKNESEKRKNFCESRRKNRRKKTYVATSDKHMKNICSDKEQHMSLHMVNANANANKDEDTSVDENAKTVDFVISEFNSITGSGFKKTTKAYRKAIQARLAEYSQEELIDVIVLKTKEWGDDDKMKHHLNPETIFRASKFPKYAESVRRIKADELNPGSVQRRNAKDTTRLADLYREVYG